MTVLSDNFNDTQVKLKTSRRKNPVVISLSSVPQPYLSAAFNFLLQYNIFLFNRWLNFGWECHNYAVFGHTTFML